MRRVRLPQTAAPAQELPLPPGEGRGEEDAAVWVCINLFQPAPAQGLPLPPPPLAKLRRTSPPSLCKSFRGPARERPARRSFSEGGGRVRGKLHSGVE